MVVTSGSQDGLCKAFEMLIDTGGGAIFISFNQQDPRLERARGGLCLLRHALHHQPVLAGLPRCRVGHRGDDSSEPQSCAQSVGQRGGG